MPLYDYEDEIVYETAPPAEPSRSKPAKKKSKFRLFVTLISVILICLVIYSYWFQNYG